MQGGGQGQGQQNQPAVIPKMFSRSTAPAPTIDGELHHSAVVKHLIVVKVTADREGIAAVIIGDGAGTEPDANTYGTQNISEGRKWLLASFESPSIQALLAGESTHGPGIWHYVNTNMIGDAPRQDTLRDIIHSMYFDGSQSALEFTSQFMLIAREMNPPMGAATAKQALSSCFPFDTPEQYQIIISTVNLQHPNANLVQFVGHLVSALQRNASIHHIHQRHRIGQAGMRQYRGGGYMLAD